VGFASTFQMGGILLSRLLGKGPAFTVGYLTGILLIR